MLELICTGFDFEWEGMGMEGRGGCGFLRDFKIRREVGGNDTWEMRGFESKV